LPTIGRETVNRHFKPAELHSSWAACFITTGWTYW